ncbi:Eukaryotic translation initiation factor 4 gamma 1, partial [Geodia barretti]
MLTAIEKAETEEKKKELTVELKVMETRARKRSLGNIRFIGELFKLKMLSETIMHECMIRLLKSSSDEESLECFAGLITTTGRDLDIPEAKTRIDGYFSRIHQIIAKGKISARIRFMLQDVIELRKNKWVPRSSQTTSLKTIDQVLYVLLYYTDSVCQRFIENYLYIVHVYQISIRPQGQKA